MYKLVISNLGYEEDLSQYEKEYSTLKEVKVVVNKITTHCRKRTLDNYKIEYDNTEFKEDLFNENNILNVLHSIDDPERCIYIRKLQ